MAIENPFSPGFGNRPSRIVGRQEVIDRFLAGLQGRPGNRNRATFFIGQRGMGKTALLLEIAAQAESYNFIPVRVTANEKLLDNIIDKIQLQGPPYLAQKNKPIKGFSAGALGFSFGLTFSDEVRENFGFQSKLTLLCNELSKHDAGLLLLVDEVHTTSEEIRELATGYQELVGDGANIAIALAGLPTAVSAVLNDDILTFLNRAHKEPLDMLSITDVGVYYHEVFKGLGISMSAELIEVAAAATRGYPYLLQLIGHYLVELGKPTMAIDPETLALAVRNSKLDMVNTTFAPVLQPLSQKDMQFLTAMAVDDQPSRVSDIAKRLGVSGSHVQTYKVRLMAAGVIASPKRGFLEFLIPYLGEHISGEF